MKSSLPYVKIAIPFIWVGFVAAISFMEAWLKFTAPGVTLTVGLSIGKVVFGALNKTELVFTVLVALALLAERRLVWSVEVFYFVAVVVVMMQSLWVLPLLSARIDLYQAGITPPASDAHLYFIVLEVIKTVSLLVYGVKQSVTWKQQKHAPLAKL